MPPETLRGLTEALVTTPSHEDESAAGEFIADWLRTETDATVEIDDAGNVIARKGSGSPSLALVGHHDVVEPAENQWDGDRIAFEERDGRLYGRGTADMKGAVAAMMLAMRDADPESELIFASFAGEEQGGVGARAAVDEGVAPDFAVVGEGSASYSQTGVLDVAVAHKGRRGSTIRAAGKTAHASEPEAGENAIYRATDAVGIIRELEPPRSSVFDTDVEGSLAVTEIEGGTTWNVIPDSCELTVDERTVPGDRADLESVESIDGITWEVDQDLPPMACDDQGFADHVLTAADGVQPGEPDHVVKPHATDAGWLAAAGTTCVVCGPAEPGEAHTDTESVDIGLLGTARDVYLELADGWPPW